MLLFRNYAVSVWLCLVTCMFVCKSASAIVPYLVDTQDWSLHILFYNIDIDLNYYLHIGIMRD